jgi:hypothetical protein
MSSVMVFCPKTSEAIYTGIEMDELTFANLPEVISRAFCQTCGVEHRWTKRKAWLAELGWQAGIKRPCLKPLKLVA